MSVRTLRYNTMNQHITKSALASTDRDALAFLEAAKIYNTNQQRAIVNLVRSLKRAGLWSKMKAIYPFVGGTASSHKWNLKDPRDVDAAFRLTFSGGWTHSANGADPNGTNAYADTFLQPSSQLTLNDSHHSSYLREDINALYMAMGAGSLSGSATSTLIPRWSNVYYGRVHADSNTTTSNTSSLGFFLVSRTSSTQQKLHKNGSLLVTGNVNSSARPTSNFYIGDWGTNTGAASYPSANQCAFATIGDGLTDTDATNLYNIVDLYQRRLGRNV